ncbi:helix-turn-helix transcriptional regulator [Pedobacter sp. MC2016-24]|uniref:helix-turn-helix transcriptional regulator n=1 Tax=Pedobacter sp. MC2016-24 TaxID=2780090 RepID=UPI00187F1693|nr:AraC family transcriptional regulator [Pedobacter sp. MC2016-24]MBE9600122.1 helix-turn-helix transcriptional regulator [Pedobacter sp. MC2016-24]
MKYNRILVNNNEIISELTHSAYFTEVTGRYAVNAVFSGEVDYTIEKRKLTLVPGSFIFLNDDTCYTHKIASAEGVSRLSIAFDPGYISDFEASVLESDAVLLDQPTGGKKGRPRLLESIYPLNGDIKYSLMHLSRHVDNGVADQLLLSEYLNHCLLNYYHLYQSEITSREASLNFLNGSTKTEILKRLCVAKDYMISNYNKNIRLEDIAEVACLSVNHLLRTFKQAYQQTPHQYLTKVRLRQAKYLLRNTDYPINEIVDIVGFECPSSFIRLFRNSFNVTPGKFR